MNFAAPVWFQPLGWTLLHFLWQGSLIAAALALTKFVLKPAAAEARYNLACLALLVTLAAPIVTFWRLTGSSGDSALAIPASWTVLSAPVSTGLSLPAADSFHTLILPALVGFWLCGVLLLSLRCLGAWWLIFRYRRSGLTPVSSDQQASLHRVAQRLGLSRPVRIFQSARTYGPMVAGWLRPVILMPAAALAGLSTQQFEAVLAHELAHIRRHDYLVNLLATVVETLLFYHPAVWWISKQIRAEREHCCDDLAVQACGDPLVLARALVELEEFRGRAVQLAMAASDGSLSRRIHRLVDPSAAPQNGFGSWLAALILTVSAAVLLTWGIGTPTTLLAQTQATKSTPYEKWLKEDVANIITSSTPYKKWLNEDVVYIITPAERKEFEALRTDADRDRFIKQFWRKRNPAGAPENKFKEEHYRRISYVNEHYGTSGMPGWRTDLGRIYIVYGPPDEIESHPSISHGIEQWRYRFIPGLGSNIEFDFDGPRLAKDPTVRT